MDITFRTLGAWGAGKGANLEASEVDSNFWSLAEAIIALQNDPPEANGIASITVSGTQMTITLTDGTVMGPFILPVLTFRWRGEYEAGAIYAVLDVVTVSTGNPWIADTSTVRYGIFMVQVALPAAPMFDPDLQIDGSPVFLQLFGSVDTLLSTLGDVAVDEPPGFNPLAEGHVLRWTFDTNKWVNSYLGSMAVQDANNVNISGGHVGGLPAPLAPGDAATKAYVDALPAGMMVDDRTMMANISGLTGPALANTLSDFLDYALLTSARGTMLYRGASGWVALPPGTAGLFLQTAGAGADLAWAVGGSGVTSVAAGAGISTGGAPITASGSVALAAVADNSLLANITGSSAAPAAATLTAFLDHVASSTRGAILTRSGSGWVALAPGTSGYYLQTQGATADAVWSSPSGSGTVTSISAGTGISTGGAPITGAGTVSLAAIATASVLANISGGSAAPVPATVSVVFDSVFGSTQGAVVYRNATTWVMLPPGTSGQVFTTGGASANPAWANAASGAPIANLLLLANISGSTAAPSGNTLSNVFDAILGSSRGMLVYRGSAGWVALSPGTSGDVLTTGGTAGDPHWAATAAGGASISVGDTAPASPSAGDAWWDSLGGQLYIRYNDGTSSQWVPASNQPGPAGATGATGATGPAGSANMSGMTAGQIPIAATATTITSSGNLSGAVTTSGSLATTLANNAVATAHITNANVTYAKIQNVAANRLLGNATGSAAAPAEIALPLVVTNGGTGAATLPAGANTNAAFNMARGVLMGAGTGAVTADPSWGGYTPADGGLVGVMASATLNPYVEFSRALGTPGTPAAVANNTILGAIQWDGYDTAWVYGKAIIYGEATESWTTTNHGARIRIQATPTGGNVTADQMTIQNGVIVGAPTGSFKGVGTLNATGVYGAGTILTSDASLKRDIGELPACLPLVAAIEPKSYRWREPEDIATVPPGWAEQTHWGFLAQDVERALAGHEVGVVDVGEDGIRGLSLGDMNAVLWQAVRELSAKVEALERARR